MQNPSELKSQYLAFQTICGNTISFSPMTRQIIIVCPTKTTSQPFGLATKSYTFACLCKMLLICSIGFVRQKIRLLTVATAIRSLPEELGTKAKKCLSVLQVLQTSIVASWVRACASQQSSRQIHCEFEVESWRVKAAKREQSGLMAREEVMLVGMTLEKARLREVAINLNQPNIIKTGSPIRTESIVYKKYISGQRINSKVCLAMLVSLQIISEGIG